MAVQRRKPGSQSSSGGSGRVTPKGGVPPKSGEGGGSGRRRRVVPEDQAVQIGRRPSSPGFLLVVGVMWLAVGVVMMVTLSATWRFVPGIVSLGIGLMFLRGAGATELRREHRRSSGR